jgi:hypothetical protein
VKVKTQLLRGVMKDDDDDDDDDDDFELIHHLFSFFGGEFVLCWS